MPITKQKKAEIVEGVTAALKDSESVVFVNFHGLKVEEANTLRRQLRDHQVGYTVAKKTLVGRALDTLSLKGERPAFDGELAVAYLSGEGDILSPAREVRAFGTAHKDAVAILGGIFEGAYKNKEEMIEIADIPSLDTLRGMFVNILNSPIQGLAVALSAIAETKTE